MIIIYKTSRIRYLFMNNNNILSFVFLIPTYITYLTGIKL